VNVFEEMLVKMVTTDLEANREYSEAVVVHKKVPNEEIELGTVGALEDGYGDERLGVRSRGRSKKRTPGRWCVPGEVGRCPRSVDPPCHSCTAQGTYS
jgi:hypothetical protein